MQKYFVHTFEEILFELKYDVPNDKKEEESGIELVRKILIMVLQGVDDPI